MKTSGETKLLLGLTLFVVLGAGFLFLSSRAQEAAEQPTPPVQQTTAETFEALVKNARHVKGDAPVTIVEFADFECPSCRRAYASVSSKFGKAVPVRFVFRHLPLEKHPMAFPAAVAAEAAGRQGKFWEMYDALFAPTVSEEDLSPEFIEKSAKKIGLDMERFRKDQNDPAVAALVQADRALADEHRVDMTPTFFLRDAQGNVSQVSGGDQLMKLLAEKNLMPGAASPATASAPPGPPAP